MSRITRIFGMALALVLMVAPLAAMADRYYETAPAELAAILAEYLMPGGKHYGKPIPAWITDHAQRGHSEGKAKAAAPAAEGPGEPEGPGGEYTYTWSEGKVYSYDNKAKWYSETDGTGKMTIPGGSLFKDEEGTIYFVLGNFTAIGKSVSSPSIVRTAWDECVETLKIALSNTNRMYPLTSFTAILWTTTTLSSPGKIYTDGKGAFYLRSTTALDGYEPLTSWVYTKLP